MGCGFFASCFLGKEEDSNFNILLLYVFTAMRKTEFKDMAMNQFFPCFCINRNGLGPLYYLSSRSDFGFEFSEIFIFENRLPASVSRGVHKTAWSIHFFKPLNNSIVIVHYIPGLFFA